MESIFRFSLAAVILSIIRLPLLVPNKETNVPVKSPLIPRWLRNNKQKQAFVWGFLLLGWMTVWFNFNDIRKALAQVDSYAIRKEYSKVLTAATQLQKLTPSAEIRLYQALYHTGQLGEELFSFPNLNSFDLLPALKMGLNACRSQSELLLELGQVTMAEHFAHEALEWEGDRPEILRLLIQINLLKERPKIARIFLNALGQIPFQQSWARICLRELDTNPQNLAQSEELSLIRSRKVSSDMIHTIVDAEAVFLQSLNDNRHNQMAFEFLMAHYLLNGRADKIAEEIGRLNDFNYINIPRHYEEAILVYMQSNGQVDLKGRQIRPATLQRFQKFTAILQRHANGNQKDLQELAMNFGDTFYYYYLSRKPGPIGFDEQLFQ